VTNLRLEAYNGLHLVLLTAGTATRCVAYSSGDLGLAREVLAAGAFFEQSSRISDALIGYVLGDLPPFDRRRLISLDRRQIPRGGRRCTDR
jgi:hypothetical protein